MKNKLYLITFITLFFILLLSSQCFAVDISVLPNGMYDSMTAEDKEAISKCSYYCIIRNSTGGFLITSNYEISVKKTYNSSSSCDEYSFFIPSGYVARYKGFTYDSSTDTYNMSHQSLPIGNITETMPLVINADINSIDDANQNLSDSETGEVFFQPLVTMETTLAPIIAEVETEKTLEEIVLILPMILLILVGLIGLRKGLRMLSTVLRQS